MKVLRFDSIGGASGDMILGTMIALGVDVDTLNGVIDGLPIEKCSISCEATDRHCIAGTLATVHIDQHEHHHHRNLDDICKIIDEGNLPGKTAKMAKAVFTRLGEAEAKVHNTTIDKIHFHEVGALDSIVDIVASCAALEILGVDSVEVGPLPVGTGSIKCAHGTLPLPVPATTELLQGRTVVTTDEPFELVTPTGAALLTAWAATQQVISNQLSVISSGYGLGQRTLNGRANALRGTILESTDPASPEATPGQATDSCLVLECNLDDTVPELLGSLCQKLVETGALDVFTTAIQMKKQRPGTLLTVLCKPEDKPAVLDLIFRESTTFGVREYEASRTILDRRHEEVETEYGKVRIKIGTWKGEDITRSPEYEDCAKLAESAGVSVRTVYEAAIRQTG